VRDFCQDHTSVNKNYILTKPSNRTKLGRCRAAITWFPATWGELTLLDMVTTLSAAVELLTLSTSEADDDGDSPNKRNKVQNNREIRN